MSLPRKSLETLKIAFLRARGNDVDWSCHIHWSARFERGDRPVVLGRNVTIDRGVIIRPHDGFVRIGDHSSINAYSVLYGNGGLSIGNDVRIAAHTVIVAANHIYADRDVPIHRQGEEALGITIEDDVWIGAGVQVLDGVRIGTGCVVAAGAVVSRSLAAFGVYAGVPARLLKKR